MSASAATEPTHPTPGAQRDALERILASGVLDRAPNLAMMLRYVCEQTFAGRVSDIKEYNIAVEALGRDPGFDQKKDAIVRVEAHKLRKRLGDYYRNHGADDPVEISLPAGSYAPRFQYRERPAEGPSVTTPETSVADAEPGAPTLDMVVPVPEPAGTAAPTLVNVPEPPQRLTGTHAEPGRNRLVPLLFVALAVLVALGTLAVLRNRNTTVRTEPVAPAPAPPAVVAGPQPGIRILAGSGQKSFVDQDGLLWSPDRYFTGGVSVTSPPRPIARTSYPEMYLTRREGDFTYKIPLAPGVYELRLHFAETVFGEGNIAGGGESSRVFSVTANGAALPITDALAEAGGPNTASVRVFKDIAPASNGFLHLTFSRVKDQGFVNAIEIVPGLPGRMRPVRIAARPSGFASPSGEHWSSDRYFSGGQPVARQEAVEGAALQDIFRGERFGNFNYEVPVAPNGRYSVTLHFAERWFGPDRPGGGGEGSRIFDVYCNGRTLLHGFDVFKVAEGSQRAVTKTFRGLEPNAQGKLLLMFVPVRNYAMINGIEVVDDAR